METSSSVSSIPMLSLGGEEAASPGRNVIWRLLTSSTTSRMAIDFTEATTSVFGGSLMSTQLSGSSTPATSDYDDYVYDYSLLDLDSNDDGAGSIFSKDPSTSFKGGSQWYTFKLAEVGLVEDDLYVKDPITWDARAAFLSQVAGKLYLLPPALVVGVVIGCVLWLLLTLMFKLFLLAGKYRSKFFEMACCDCRLKNSADSGCAEQQGIKLTSAVRRPSSEASVAAAAITSVTEETVTVSSKEKLPATTLLSPESAMENSSQMGRL